MYPWNFRKGFLRLTTILLMLLILALMGCSDDDDDDDVTAGDLAGRTFVFADAGFFDPALTGLSARTGVRQRDRQYNAFRADPGRHGAYGYCDHWFTAELPGCCGRAAGRRGHLPGHHHRTYGIGFGTQPERGPL